MQKVFRQGKAIHSFHLAGNSFSFWIDGMLYTTVTQERNNNKYKAHKMSSNGENVLM